MNTKFKNLINKHKISQSELARIFDLSRPTIIKILSGERELRVSEADKLAMNLGISTTEIFGETSEVEVILEKKSAKKKSKLKERISVPARNVEKFKNALLYITQKIGALPNVGQTVLYKILYFCDFDYYEKYEEQLIGATYIKNHFGPTPREFSAIVKEMIQEGKIEEITTKFFDKDQKKYIPVISPDLSVFSGRELQHIDEEIVRLGHKTAKELSDFSHQDVPWISTEIGKNIPYEAVFYRTKRNLSSELMKKIKFERNYKFDKQFKKLTRKYHTLEDDLAIAKKFAIEAFHLHEINNEAVFLIPNFDKKIIQIYKLKKFSCKALKGKGSRSGIRIIYAFFPQKFEVEFLEIYIKEKDASDMDYKFVKKYFESNLI